METEEFYKYLRKHQEKLYSIDINGQDIQNSDLLIILIRKLAELYPHKWVEENKISALDMRSQLFIRFDMAFVHYYQSIISTLHSTDLLWNVTTKNLGYYKEYAFLNLTFREVYLRTSFFEKVFFTIDYFIQQMNTFITFYDGNSTHKKQQYFKLLLEKIDLDDKELETDKIVDELNKLFQDDGEAKLFVKKNNRKIKYHEVYDYLVALRNVFHNNGFSQKTMNNLNIGGVQIEIVKNKQIRFSQDTLIIIIFMMLNILEEIVETTFKLYPNQEWIDPYANDIKIFMEK
jgi:hypothetical protein